MMDLVHALAAGVSFAVGGLFGVMLSAHAIRTGTRDARKENAAHLNRVETRLEANSPIKSCDNCAYSRGSGDYARCAKSGYYCTVVRQCSASPGGLCDGNFSGWIQRPPAPPRRSFRAWIYDLLFA